MLISTVTCKIPRGIRGKFDVPHCERLQFLDNETGNESLTNWINELTQFGIEYFVDVE